MENAINNIKSIAEVLHTKFVQLLVCSHNPFSFMFHRIVSNKVAKGLALTYDCKDSEKFQNCQMFCRFFCHLTCETDSCSQFVRLCEYQSQVLLWTTFWAFSSKKFLVLSKVEGPQGGPSFILTMCQ